MAPLVRTPTHTHTQTFSPRHYSNHFHRKCTTPKVLEHLSGLDSLEDLVGFSELHEEDQERVRKAVEEGHVSETEG